MKRCVHMLLILGLLGCARAQATPAAENLVANGGFEDGMAHWMPSGSGAQGSAQVDEQVSHSGNRSLRISNASGYAPHVWFRVSQQIRGIKPFSTYRISCQVKAEDAGIVWIGGGPGWHLRKAFPEGSYDWQPVELEYSTGELADDFELMILTESVTKACWVDDVRFELVRTDEAKLAEIQQGFDQRLAERKQSLLSLRKRAQAAGRADDPYVKLGLTVAQRFIDRIEKGEAAQSMVWSNLQLAEVGQVLERVEQQLSDDAPQLPGEVRWRDREPVEIRDGKFFLGQAQTPFFFNGYGHFDALIETLPEFRDLGVSLIQDGRIGPSSMDADGKLLENAQRVIDGLKKAAEHGVMTDFLISPHYFPQWGYEQAPDLLNHNAGFLAYNINHPRGRQIMEQWLRTLLPKIKDSPALLSYCLSNEPVYVMSGRDPHSRPLYEQYLRELHGSIETLNQLYSTQYDDFSDVAVPGHGLPEGDGPRRAYYDWCRFNQQNFVAWHKWMGDVIKSIDPNAKTHAKVMVFFAMDRDKLHFGMDPELFCEITEIAGCDAYAFMTSGNTFDWHGHAFWYDMLHSFRRQPVFNGENHIIPDRTPAHTVPPEHTRAVLWQGALHHMGASTIWVWEEASHPDLIGSIYFRPGNVHGAGTAMLDVNRLAEQVAAITDARPRVALLYSWPSIFWSERYKPTITGLYTHLNFLGEKITFVSERQLADGKLPDVDVVIVPAATHVQDETVVHLDAFIASGGKVIVCSEDDLQFDQYNRRRDLPKSLQQAARLDLRDAASNHRRVAEALAAAGVPLRRLSYVEKEGEVWNIEYRLADHEQGSLIPLINFAGEAQTVRLPKELGGAAVDLLSGRKIDPQRISLQPMVPLLLQMEQ